MATKKPTAKKRNTVPLEKRPLSDRQRRFVDEYLVDLNGTQAAIRAGYTPTGAEMQAHRLLSDVRVRSLLEQRQADRVKRTEITQDEVLRRFWAMATADSRELIEYRRGACRYCYGEGHRYQRTQGEQERAMAEHAQLVKAGKARGEFDPKGGIGYDPRKPPHADCPECFGQGVGYTHLNDTRNLSESAALIYAGVKQTKEGIEVKQHSQAEALLNVGRHVGLFNDKMKLDVTVDAVEAMREFLMQRGSRLPIATDKGEGKDE